MSEVHTPSKTSSPPKKSLMPDWALSWRCYIVGTLPFILRTTSNLLLSLNVIPEQYFDSIPAALVVEFVVLLATYSAVRPTKFGIAWRAILLGFLLNIGLTLATYSSAYETFGIYCIILSIFHWSEFMMQSIFNPDTTTEDSYMLYHSNEYIAAVIVCIIEYSVEFYFWPGMKTPNIVTNLGISLIMFGECLRKAAMYTAKSNFNHYVQFEKNDGHELVTHGVYGLFRHPSYVGWFWWSVGMQCILFNPVCVFLYAAASWKFFSDRIYTEEITLIKFFGHQYLEYQQKVGTGIPFIEGYIVTLPVNEKDE